MRRGLSFIAIQVRSWCSRVWLSGRFSARKRLCVKERERVVRNHKKGIRPQPLECRYDRDRDRDRTSAKYLDDQASAYGVDALAAQ